MTSAQRVKAAVEFTGPDRVPFAHCYLPASVAVFAQLQDLLRRYPSDIAGGACAGLDDPMYKKGQWRDVWDCLWTVAVDGLLGQVTEHPLKDEASIRTYKWPKASDLDISADQKLAENKADAYARVGAITLFERMIDLRGYEETLIDILEGEENFAAVSGGIFRYNMELIDRYIAMPCDCVAFADDWGTQRSLMIAPDLWRERFLPMYRAMFQKVRAAGKHVFFHTDGYTIDILPDLAEVGAHIFWVDMTVNPMEALGQKLGGKVCFQALTDVQFLLRTGTPDAVRAYGKKLLRTFADFGGGFIACSEIEPDHPWENVQALFETFAQYGCYPRCDRER